MGTPTKLPFLAKKICRIVMLSRITLYIGVVSAVVICASALPVGLSDTSDELSDEAYNLALAEAETALQTSEGNGFGDVFKNLFKTVHNAALQAKIKKALGGVRREFTRLERTSCRTDSSHCCSQCRQGPTRHWFGLGQNGGDHCKECQDRCCRCASGVGQSQDASGEEDARSQQGASQQS